MRGRRRKAPPEIQYPSVTRDQKSEHDDEISKIKLSNGFSTFSACIVVLPDNHKQLLARIHRQQ